MHTKIWSIFTPLSFYLYKKIQKKADCHFNDDHTHALYLKIPYQSLVYLVKLYNPPPPPLIDFYFTITVVNMCMIQDHFETSQKFTFWIWLIFNIIHAYIDYVVFDSSVW